MTAVCRGLMRDLGLIHGLNENSGLEFCKKKVPSFIIEAELFISGLALFQGLAFYFIKGKAFLAG